MQIIQVFRSHNFSIRFENFEPKENMYYPPTKELHRFDLIKIFFLQEGCARQLFEDILQEGLTTFLSILKRLIAGQLVLKSENGEGAGRLYNEALHADSEEIDFFSRYLVWEVDHTFTFFYEKNEKFYLEIAPNYPWHFSESNEQESYVPFEIYIRNYKPLIAIAIEKETIEKWLTQCLSMLKKAKVIME